MRCQSVRVRDEADEAAAGGSAAHRAGSRLGRPRPKRLPTASRTTATEERGERLKLLVVIVADTDADGLIAAMIERGFPATKIGSTGGFLRRGNTTLLSGVEAEAVDDVLALVRRLCPARTELLTVNALPVAGEVPFLTEPIEVRAGGAVIFVLDVERFERI